MTQNWRFSPDPEWRLSPDANKVERWDEVIPPTIEGIRAYLASGLLKGIGPKTADAIVQRFGTKSLSVIESHPEQLLEIRGITEEKLAEIKEGYAESKVLRDLMTILAPFKVTPSTAIGLWLSWQSYPRLQPDKISVRRVRVLPSFRFRLTTDTLGFGYVLPTAGRTRDFHPLERALAGRTR